MRSYLIDEISPSQMEQIKGFLEKYARESNLVRIFWVRIPDDLLSTVQLEHDDCRPHVFAVELGQDWIKLEFFVRSREKIQCTCPAYCTTQQRDYIINFAHSMIKELDIRT